MLKGNGGDTIPSLGPPRQMIKSQDKARIALMGEVKRSYSSFAGSLNLLLFGGE